MRQIIFTTILLALPFYTFSQVDYPSLSTELLNAVRHGQSTENIEKQLAEVSLEDLSKALDSDKKRLTFWMNIYNAYVQILLTKGPSLFDDRGAFFTQKRVIIVQKELSFDDIEHGIIRGSKWKLGLGIIPKPFPKKFERKLRVKKTDPRIHLALNCGALGCPPVAAYELKRINEMMDKSSRLFLEKTTVYNKEKNEVTITPLFSWFRGDWGSKRKVRKFLQKYEILPQNVKPKIKYGEYDWTLSTGNYIEL